MSPQSTRKYLQEEDCYIQAGKIKVLLSLLDTYQEDNRRVLIFSQVSPSPSCLTSRQAANITAHP